MSSGSASKLVNGQNKKENVHAYNYENRKGNESGAAGSTASSIVVLAGDTRNATTLDAATGTDTSASSIRSSGSVFGSDSGNGGTACFGGSCGDGDSGSNSGVCVIGLTAGGVVDSVEYHDVNSDFKTPDNLEEIQDQRDSNDETELCETEFQDP